MASDTVALRKQVQDLKEAAEVRRRLEDALRGAETLLRATIEEAAVGILRLGPAGEFLLINRAFLDHLRYASRQEFQATGLRPQVFADDREMVRVLEEARRGQDRIAANLRQADGAVVVAALLARPSGRDATGVTLVLSEISREPSLRVHSPADAAADTGRA